MKKNLCESVKSVWDLNNQREKICVNLWALNNQ